MDASASATGVAGVELMNQMIERCLTAIDALDRKLALVPAALGVLAALLLPDPLRHPVQLQLAAGGGVLSVVAVGFALLGLSGRQVSIGPDPAGLTARFGDTLEQFYVDVAGALTVTLEGLRDSTAEKAWHLNIALVASSAATLLFLSARLLAL